MMREVEKMKIIIKKQDYQEIVNHCQEEYPHEACGVLAGKNCVVEKIYRMENTSPTPQDSYFMNPSEQLKVFKEIRNLNLELLAIYHSHINTPAFPSAKDVELAYYPDASYIIVSVVNREIQVKLFKIEENKITEKELEILN